MSWPKRGSKVRDIYHDDVTGTVAEVMGNQALVLWGDKDDPDGISWVETEWLLPALEVN